MAECSTLKGITLVDIDENAGKTALMKIEKEFGTGRAVFVRSNISSKQEFEFAFRKTLETFNHIDILINNAGIYSDLNWENEVDINIKGTINGIILGLETYLKNHKQGEEAVILNTSSIAAIRPGPWMPIYGCTKAAIAGLTQSWGHDFHYERTKVRVVAICPGGTHTGLFQEKNCALTSEYMVAQGESKEKNGPDHRQSPDFVSEEVVKILKYAKNGSLWIVEFGEPAYQYVFPERETFKENLIEKV
ncbi:unnamed protein product [Psylliodes chrysocephalus]|uniref:15-hydroxyprostaglandin dehydrogenase [NAD(+)]-like n=1 Tax=Psylliodes chrysocephalus TaxID=3402493 RepID=A0A9P0G7G5_9CUCU|nr:unnamed protein product [Psylliodes chrysocephala]